MTGFNFDSMISAGPMGIFQEHMKVTDEGALITLGEIYARICEGNPFKGGDLVAPRKGYGLTFEGKLGVVAETRVPDTEDPDSVRVLSIIDGIPTPVWYEHWQLEEKKVD